MERKDPGSPSGPPRGVTPTTSDQLTVVVIGAGLTGAMVSHELAEAGHHVVCVDQGAIGHGSSSRSAACIRTQFTSRANVEAMLYSIDFFERFRETIDGNGAAITQNGYLYPFWAWEEAAWKEATAQYHQMREWGVDAIELLQTGEAIERFPFLQPDGLLGARFCGRDGFLHPSVIMQDTFTHCREAHGLELRQNCPVTEILFSGDQVTGVVTPQGQITADFVVNCSNAWTGQLLAQLPRNGAPFPTIEPHKRFLYFTEIGDVVPLEEFKRWPMTVLHSGSYSHPDGDKLMMGWAHPSVAEPDFTDDDQDDLPHGFHSGSGGVHYGFRMLQETAIHLWPVAGMPGIHSGTCGYYGVTPDAMPIIDRDPEYSGLIHAVGFSGHGAMFCPASGLVVRHLIDPAVKVPFSIEGYRVDRDFTASGEHAVI